MEFKCCKLYYFRCFLTTQHNNHKSHDHRKDKITFSTTIGKGAPFEFTLDLEDGDITIYNDRNGVDGLYMIRDFGTIKADIIGGNEEAMKKMLNSVDITSTYMTMMMDM